MRISDWSSDVCSSDLLIYIERLLHAPGSQADLPPDEPASRVDPTPGIFVLDRIGTGDIAFGDDRPDRRARAAAFMCVEERASSQLDRNSRTDGFRHRSLGPSHHHRSDPMTMVMSQRMRWTGLPT